MLDVIAVVPLPGHRLSLTLSDGSVVERDVSDCLWGPVFARIAADESAFNEVTVANGTAAWLRDGADIAPETLIWNGPEPLDGSGAVPPETMKVLSPDREHALP